MDSGTEGFKGVACEARGRDSFGTELSDRGAMVARLELTLRVESRRLYVCVEQGSAGYRVGVRPNFANKKEIWHSQ